MKRRSRWIIPAVVVWVTLGTAAVLQAPAALAASVEDDFRAGQRAYLAGDVIGALSSLRKAADAGYAPAQVLLAEILDRAEFNEDAVAYYRKAAEQDSADGEFGLGTMYHAGEGVKKDAAQALFWYRRAAARNHARAIQAIAHAYVVGDLGLDEKRRDNAEAAAALRRAAEIHYVPAVEALARAYKTGDFGLKPDAQQAQLWEAKLKELRPPPPGKGQKKRP